MHDSLMARVGDLEQPTIASHALSGRWPLYPKLAESLNRPIQGDQMSLWKKNDYSTYIQPVPFLSKLIRNMSRGKKEYKNLRYFCNFLNSAQRKQLLNGRKFAQSGHPGPIPTNKPERRNPRATKELKGDEAIKTVAGHRSPCIRG
jgi:hypothetical protein